MDGSGTLKIVLHGACSYPFFYREMLPAAREAFPGWEWRVTVLSWRHARVLEDRVLPGELFYIQPEINRVFVEELQLKLVAGLPQSLSACLAVDKGEPGQMRGRDKEYQLRNAVAYYRVYRAYLERERPDAVFIPVIETHESMILYAVAQELGIETFVNTFSRSAGVSFFSPTPNEDLPLYAFSEIIPEEIARKASAFVDLYRQSPGTSLPLGPDPFPGDLLPLPPRLAPTTNFLRRFPRAVADLARDLREEPHAARSNPFWYQPRVQFLGALKIYRNLRGERDRRFFEVRRIEELPARFVYLPLQLSPESSINTLAPFFADQLRAVDLLLQNIPPDCRLVVKEHPKMKGSRPAAFYRALHRMPGVLLADFDVPGFELIRRAALTVTVTGTSAFEALLLGRPSISLARTFFSPWVDRFDSFDDFTALIRKAMETPEETIILRARDCISRILLGGYDFVLMDPYNVDIPARYTMNKRNLQAFLGALASHVDRMKAARA